MANGKSLFNVSAQTSLLNQSFFSEFHSCGLIEAYQTYSLRIMGKSNFTNIWLIDRLQAMFPFQNELSRGLILTVKSSVGHVQIGDTDPKKVTTFQNLTGFLNPQSIAKFPSWNPKYLDKQLANTLVSSISVSLGINNTLGSVCYN